MTRWLPLLALEAALVLAWSSGYIGARLAADTSSFIQVLLWRFLVVSLLLLPFVLAYVRRLTLSELGHQALVGALAMFGFLALGVAAIDLGVPAGTAALIAASQPLMTAALAGPVLGDRVTGRQWIGIGVGLIGIAIAIGGEVGPAPLLAYLLSLTSTLSLVIGTLIAKARPMPTPLLPALGLQSVTTALLLLPIAALDSAPVDLGDTGFLWAVAWFVIFSTLGGYGFYWLCLRRSSATRVSSLIYLTPPVTMLWAWALFGQAVGASALIGLLFCFAAVVLARDRRGPEGEGSCRKVYQRS